MIVIVDYGAANLLSITRALEAVGASVKISDSPADIMAAAGVVLPGVGAAGTAMERLRASGGDMALRAVAASSRPLLGLCLGMQLFFEWLAEDDTAGLGILPGEVPLLPPGQKIPHMGWNTLTWKPNAPGTELFAGLESGAYAYFVHSYHCVPTNSAEVVAHTDYGQPICAAVASSTASSRVVEATVSHTVGASHVAPAEQRNVASIHGLQFHPEKSGAAGLRMLASWLALVTSSQGAQARAQAKAEASTCQP